MKDGERWFEWTPRFVKYREAAKLLGLRENYISIFKYTNKDKVPYIFKDGDLVDVEWFITNIILRKELRNEIHNIFFHMTEDGWKNSEIARAMVNVTKYGTQRSWEVFLSDKMWREKCCIKNLALPPIRAMLFSKHWKQIFNEGRNRWRKRKKYQEI
jgi:hypothetical protein